jgi:hypothetical protein
MALRLQSRANHRSSPDDSATLHQQSPEWFRRGIETITTYLSWAAPLLNNTPPNAKQVL